MPRRRRVLIVALLLLVLLGAGGGYTLAHRAGPSPILRTVTVGVVPGHVVVDASTNRAFVNNYADHSVSVLDGTSGAVLRTVAIGDAVASFIVDVPTNRVYLVSDDSSADFLLDAGSGAVVSRIDQPDGFGTVDPRTGQIFVTIGDTYAGANQIAVLDGRTGLLRRSTDLTGKTPLSVVVDPRTDHVFAADAGDNTLSMVGASDGRLLRTVRVGSFPVGLALDSRTGRAFVLNNGANTVSMLDTRSGAVLRTITVAPHPATAAVDERTGRVFVSYGPSGTTGSTLAQSANPVPPVSQASQVGLTVLDARTGTVLNSLPVGGGVIDDQVGWTLPTNIAVDARRSLVFVTNRVPRDGDGSLSVLDARSGDLLHTVGVGRHPISLAVDEATARLFVVNTNAGCVRPPGLWQYMPSFARRLLPFLPGPPKPTCNLPGSVSVIDTSHL